MHRKGRRPTTGCAVRTNNSSCRSPSRKPRILARQGVPAPVGFPGSEFPTFVRIFAITDMPGTDPARQRRGCFASRQCLSTTGQASRIASANGNSSTISPSSSMEAYDDGGSSTIGTSVFKSSQIMARAISQADEIPEHFTVRSEISSSPIRVLKKYRGIGGFRLRLRPPTARVQRNSLFLLPSTLGNSSAKIRFGAMRTTAKRLIHAVLTTPSAQLREFLSRCNKNTRKSGKRFSWRTFDPQYFIAQGTEKSPVFQRENRMAWKAPKIVEVPVSMEINMYVRDPQVSGRRSITTNAGGPPGVTRSRSWSCVITRSPPRYVCRFSFEIARRRIMLRVVDLGAAAPGGGVPQWNCGCMSARPRAEQASELKHAGVHRGQRRRRALVPGQRLARFAPATDCDAAASSQGRPPRAQPGRQA